MKCTRMRLWILAIMGFLAALLAPRLPAQDGAPTRPRLVVVLSIDQCRGDFIPRFESLYAPDGFRRVLREGFMYDHCLYASANTETGPGHATMLTGAYAHRNGIVGNDWFDPAAGRSVYCVDDRLVAGGRSPRNLLAGAVGDELEVATAGAARTLSVSLKDRAAILMGGHAADLALWFDRANGDFVTSAHYVEQLPEWVADFNAGKPADQWFQKEWTLSLPPEEYARRCTPDDYPSENYRAGSYTTATFPHLLGARGDAPNAAYYTAVYTSPFGNDLVLQLVQAAIPAMELGKDDVPDLLTISFSSNDPIGHAFGPSSWEVMDTCLKTDAQLAQLMTLLDEQVGRGEWSLLLTGDHGVCDFPELLREQGLDAQRVSGRALRRGLESHLRETIGPLAGDAAYIADFGIPWVTLNRGAFADPDLRARAVAAAAEWLGSRSEVACAITTRHLFGGAPDDDDVLRAFRLAHYPGRAGDLAFCLRPGCLLDDGRVGTGHGSVWRYDQFVPLLAVGRGIRHGRSATRVEPPQIAPTVAVLLGVQPPNACEVEALSDALAME